MTDDTWRRDRDDEEDEPLFDEPSPTRDQEAVDDRSDVRRQRHRVPSALDRTADGRGAPPRPRGDVVAADALGDDDELDVWSSFTSESPVWKDDSPTEPRPPTPCHGVAAHRDSTTWSPREHDESAWSPASRAGSRSAPIRRACRAAHRCRPAGDAAASRRAPGRAARGRRRSRRIATCRWRRGRIADRGGVRRRADVASRWA